MAPTATTDAPVKDAPKDKPETTPAPAAKKPAPPAAAKKATPSAKDVTKPEASTTPAAKAPAAKAPAAKTKESAPPSAAKAKESQAEKREISLTDWLKQLEQMPADEPNERYGKEGLTNGDVVHVLRYQVVREDVKGGDLTPEHGKLLRAAARAYPKILGTLTAYEKKAVGDFSDDELSEEERERATKKKGLTGKARFIWVVDGKDGNAQQADARAAGESSGSSTASKPRTPKRWREGTFKPATTDVTGSLAFVASENPLEGGALTFVGQFGDDEFYDKVHKRIKAMGMDPEKAHIITLRGRFARHSQPVAEAPEAPGTADAAGGTDKAEAAPAETVAAAA